MLKNNLNTLKDISDDLLVKLKADYQTKVLLILEDTLRQEAIKWIKEDLRIINQNPLLSIERIMAIKFVNIWMERLNITEEDLE